MYLRHNNLWWTSNVTFRQSLVHTYLLLSFIPCQGILACKWRFSYLLFDIMKSVLNSIKFSAWDCVSEAYCLMWFLTLFINLSQNVWIWLETPRKTEAKYQFLYVIASKKCLFFYRSIVLVIKPMKKPLVRYFVICYEECKQSEQITRNVCSFMPRVQNKIFTDLINSLKTQFVPLSKHFSS